MADDSFLISGTGPPGQSSGTVTVVDESSFCLSGRTGDVQPGTAQGLFFLDTRVLSRFVLTIDGEPAEPLSVFHEQPFSATFVAQGRPRPGVVDSSLLVIRRRYVGRGMREDLMLRNSGAVEARLRLELSVDIDFADLFAVKEARSEASGELSQEVGEDEIVFRHRRGELRRAVALRVCGGGRTQPSRVVWDVVLPPHGEWSACAEIHVVEQGIEPRYRCGESVTDAAPAVRHAEWHREVPSVDTDWSALRIATSSALRDLGSLRLFDPEHPGRVTVAAGAPWFMTLFGRDSLLTSYMSLMVTPELALGVLETLAELQGREVNPLTEEEPGRIMHEVRFGGSSWAKIGGGEVYYGSIDSTPLFVILLGELRRWGMASEAVDRLLPHADRALEWIERYGDRDGDGYVEYARATPSGLLNQGWKDSFDGVPFADGRLSEPPIAMCEVQGYVYAAYLARAYFAEETGDTEAVAHWREKAAALKSAFNRDFWLPDRGYYALALDREKKPVDALASNMGHCLWSGIVDLDKAPMVAARLLSPEMFSGWGVRTLATSMASYNPLSYHCGSVWPHDNAIITAGLMRYGFVSEAQQVMAGVLDAAAAAGGRLPELFSGLGRNEVGVPVPYPASCSPQAWAAATPLQFLRTLLRLDPWVPHGRLWVDPTLPANVELLDVTRIPMNGHRMDIRNRGGVSEVSPVPGLEIVREPRHPLTAALAL